MALDSDRPPLAAQEWFSAMWLPVYLIGMGIISWLGQYGGGAKLAPVNTNTIPLWWDLVVLAVFSLAIFFWAQAVKLPREELQKHVAAQTGDDPAVAA